MTPGIREQVDMAVQAVMSDTLHLAELANEQPGLVALEHQDIRAAIGVLQCVLDGVAKRNAA